MMLQTYVQNLQTDDSDPVEGSSAIPLSKNNIAPDLTIAAEQDAAAEISGTQIDAEEFWRRLGL